MSRTDQTVWKSAVDERELLRLERQTGTITIPVCTINLDQLRELELAAAECAKLAYVPRVCEQGQG